MNRHPIAVLVAGGLTSLVLMFTGISPNTVDAAAKAAKTAKKPIRNPKFDPSFEKVNLFDASDAGQIEVKLIQKDPMGGTVLIENKTDKPLNVKVPEAVVGVPILAQGFGGGGLGGFGGGGLGGGGMGGMMGGGGGGGGGGQAAGGGLGGGGGGNGGGGMFSVPAEKVVSVPFRSVCLEHGKPDPNTSMKYKLIPVSQFNTNPVLYQLLANVGTGKVDPQAAQAAAWNLSSKLSFQDLAAKTDQPLGGLEPTPYFTPQQLEEARQLLAMAIYRANENEPVDDEDQKPETNKPEPRSARVSKK